MQSKSLRGGKVAGHGHHQHQHGQQYHTIWVHEDKSTPLPRLFHKSEDEGITDEELVTMVEEAEDQGGLDRHLGLGALELAHQVVDLGARRDMEHGPHQGLELVPAMVAGGEQVLLKKLLTRLFHKESDEGITDEELVTMVEEAEDQGGLDREESQLIRSAIRRRTWRTPPAIPWPGSWGRSRRR
mgnify:CR=1 FL=1